TGISNERNITISYNFTGLPDYVSIYYSNDGNVTWNLAGNDTSVDGSFNFSLVQDGIYGFIAVAVGNGSLEEKPLPGDDAEAYPYILDTIPPYVLAEVDSPIYNDYITSLTPIYINASDLHSYNIYYRIWNGSWSAWKIHPTNISFNIHEECIHYIEYYAKDFANNSSPLYNVTFYVDNSAPETTLTLSGTTGNNGWYVSNVGVDLYATDYGCNGGCGVAFIYYKINNTWIEYNGSLLIGEGRYNISYYSVDNLGNEEQIKNTSIKVDTSPPQIYMIEYPPSITNNLTIFFEWTAFDSFNNLSYSYSLVNYSTWSNWSKSTSVYFNLTSEGNYTFMLKAKDEAGNVAIISYNFSIDMETIITTIKFIPRYNEWIGINSLINLTCYGNVNATYYRIWYNGSWHPEPGTGIGKGHNFSLYTGTFTLGDFPWAGEGQYYIEFYSDDKNANEEEVNNESILVDATSPSTFISIQKSFTKEINISFNVSSYDNVGVDYIKIYYSYSESRNFTNSVNWSHLNDFYSPYNITFSFGEVGYYAFISIGVDYVNNTENFPSQPDDIIKFYNPDLNGDGRINVLDLIKIIINWMHTPSNENWNHKIDLNGDEIINAEDLIILILSWTG
ncbi:MAG TPA: hypothetical protein ENI53_00945, partial [Thermoplasmatales archaeon]|nr:hypothetical protein [Thermoplasmatales archaeon]